MAVQTSFASQSPGSVSNLSASVTNPGGTVIHVSWDAVPGAESYEVWRAVGADFEQAESISTNSPVKLKYDDDLTRGGVEYGYWVRGSNSTGYGPFAGPVFGEQTNCLWTIPLNKNYRIIPLVRDDGVVYLWDAKNAIIGSELKAIRPDGSILWTFTDPDGIHSASVILPNGNLAYTGGKQQTFKSVDSSGRLVWATDFGMFTGTADPAVDSYGTIYFALNGDSADSYDKLCSISSDGVLLWSVRWYSAYSGNDQDHAVIGADGAVFVSGRYGLLCYETDGNKRWQYPTFLWSGYQATQVWGTPSLDYNDQVVSLARESRKSSLIRFSSSGSLLASNVLMSPNPFVCEPVIDRNGNIYYTAPKLLVCVSSSGEVRWTNNLDRSSYQFANVPAIDRMGNVYVAESKAIRVFDRNGLPVTQLEVGSEILAPPVLTSDGRLYLSSDQRLYAFQALAGLDIESPWPMYRHDPKGTASRQGKPLPPAQPVLSLDQRPFANKVRIAVDPPVYSATLELYRCDKSDFSQAIKVSTGRAGQSYVEDTTAAPGVLYHYWVRAVNAAGASDFSESVARSAVLVPIRWFAAIPGAKNTAPAVGPSGAIYTSSSDYMTALNPDGSVQWQRPGYVSVLAVAPNGSILARSDSSIISFAPDGATNWAMNLVTNTALIPAITPSNSILMGGLDFRLRSVSDKGGFQWTNASDTFISPAIATDGSVAIVTCGKILSLLNPDGSIRSATNINVSESLRNSSLPVIDGAGIMYLMVNSPASLTLVAVRPDGTVSWRLKSGDSLISPPVVDADGTVFAAFSATNQDYTGVSVAPRLIPQMAAVAADGAIRWTFNTPDFPSTPVLTANGNIIFSAGKYLYALSTKDGGVQWQLESPTGDVLGTPILDMDGALYVPMTNGLFSLQLPCGPANAPWPMHRQNARLSACQARTEAPLIGLTRLSTGGLKLSLGASGGAVILGSDDLSAWRHFGWQPPTNQVVEWPVPGLKKAGYFRVVPP